MGSDLGEQPIKADDVSRDGGSSVRTWQTPIMADRRVRTPAEAARLIEAGAHRRGGHQALERGRVHEGEGESPRGVQREQLPLHIATTPGSQIMEAGRSTLPRPLPMFGGCELAEFAALLEDPGSGLAIVDGKLRCRWAPAWA